MRPNDLFFANCVDVSSIVRVDIHHIKAPSTTRANWSSSWVRCGVNGFIMKIICIIMLSQWIYGETFRSKHIIDRLYMRHCVWVCKCVRKVWSLKPLFVDKRGANATPRKFSMRQTRHVKVFRSAGLMMCVCVWAHVCDTECVSIVGKKLL